MSQEPSEEDQAEATKRLEPQLLQPGSCGLIKRVLTGSVRWSNARKWGERGSSRSRRERAAPLLVGREREVGWQSHNSMAPVWQRPILMGEKCELPRFSGLILYDERGTPVHSSGIGTTDHHQVRIHGYLVLLLFTCKNLAFLSPNFIRVVTETIDKKSFLCSGNLKTENDTVPS